MNQPLGDHDESHEQVPETLLSGLLHDLRVCLTAFATALDTLLTQKPGPLLPQQTEFLILMQRNIARMKLMIENATLLMQGRPPTLNCHPIDLLQLCRERVEFYSPLAPSLTLRIETQGEYFWVNGTEMLATRLLDNLLSNAIRHTPDGGIISLRLFEESQGVMLEIEDTGEGIPPDYLPHLFETGYCMSPNGSRSDGLGIGLSVCKQIADQLGMDLSVSSKPTQGTTFRLFWKDPETQEDSGND